MKFAHLMMLILTMMSTTNLNLINLINSEKIKNSLNENCFYIKIKKTIENSISKKPLLLSQDKRAFENPVELRCTPKLFNENISNSKTILGPQPGEPILFYQLWSSTTGSEY